MSPDLHIFEWLPQSSAILWVRSFGISPISPLMVCYCSSCFSLTKIPTSHPCFSVNSILFMRERDSELKERWRELVLRHIWTLLLSRLQQLTGTPLCTFPLLSCSHSLLFITVLSNEDFGKNPKSCVLALGTRSTGKILRLDSVLFLSLRTQGRE